MTYHGRYVSTSPRDPEPSWRQGCSLLLTAFLAGALLGWIIASSAAPRSASATAPGPIAIAANDQRASIAPLPTVTPSAVSSASASPVPSPAQPTPVLASVRPRTRIVNGVASHMGSTQGPGYLALPEGPGRRVAITGRTGCIERVSTDAGPDKAMQRAGRVADLNVYDFEKICGPRWLGLCHVTVAYGGTCE